MALELPKALHIDHVLDGVYISGWQATQFAGYLRQAGIVNVLKLYGELPRHFPPDFNTLDLPITDADSLHHATIERGLDFIRSHVQAHPPQPVLVMCARGVNRSATFVLAYLVSRGYPLPDAFRLLRERHYQATPHPILWESLIRYFNLNYTVDDALVWMRRDERGSP